MFGRTRWAVLTATMLLIPTACSSDPGVTVSSSQTDTVDTGSVESSGSADTAPVTATDDPQPEPNDEPATVDEPIGPYEPEPIEWSELDDNTDVATLDVPVDYDDPTGDRFELFLARHRALDPDARIGSLLVNPGGPGFGGSEYARSAPFIFDRVLLERFDIVAWDPRGTGRSEPAIDCIDDYDTFFNTGDGTPETDEEHQVVIGIAATFAEECERNNATIFEHVGTNNSARDIDSIRRALGEDTISYFGLSYGSELGGAWVTLFPDTVRAAVFDGASDPNADAVESSVQQHAGFESSLESFLARCSADDGCRFHNDGDARTAFVALMEALDADPLEVDPDRPPVNRDTALLATSQAMYSEAYWPALERALADAADGDGTGLLALFDAYYRRRPDGTYGNELEAFQVISCADRSERPTVEEADADVPRFHEVAPLFVPDGSIGGYFCTFFSPAIDPRVDITGDGAGPIVVIATTGDPATPFESTVRMAEALEDGRLVVVEADKHTGYGVNRCVIDVVNDYLVDLAAPASGTECR